MKRGITLGAIIVTALVIGAMLALVAMAGPSCPTEDSCTADYRDGGWHIERTTP